MPRNPNSGEVPEAVGPPVVIHVVPKREGATFVPYIHHSETSLGLRA
jgi:hypothetical protein